MARRLTFWGKTVAELQSLTIDEVMKYLPSRARRALKRASPRYRKLLEKVKKVKAAGGEKVIKTHLRDAVILPEWCGLKFGIHNGKEFKPSIIVPEMIGKRLGDLAHTTGPVKHSGPGVGATRGSKFIPLK